MLGSLIASLAAGEAVAAIRNAVRSVVIYAIVGVLGLAAVIYLLIAAFIALERHFDPLYVALGFAAVFLIAALAIYIVQKRGAPARRRVARERRGTELKAAAIPAALSMMPGLVRSRAGIGALALGVAGIAALAIYRENAWRGPRRAERD